MPCPIRALRVPYLCLLLGAFGLQAGCHTQVAISIKPDRWVCPGTPVVLQWDASRTPRIDATPPVAALTDLPNSGSKPIALVATTHFVLTAGSWFWQKNTLADAIIYDPALAAFPATGHSQLQFARLGNDVQCTGAVAWSAFDQEEDHWDPRLSVGQVRALGGAKVTVWHDGVRADVDGTPSAAFAGTPAKGFWVFESSCNPRPRGLGIELTATCRDARPQGVSP